MAEAAAACLLLHASAGPGRIRQLAYRLCLPRPTWPQGKPAQAQRMSKRVRRLNASRRAALREVALQRLPAAVRGPPPGPPSPAPPA